MIGMIGVVEEDIVSFDGKGLKPTLERSRALKPYVYWPQLGWSCTLLDVLTDGSVIGDEVGIVLARRIGGEHRRLE
jgi:hypothetical protein